MYFIEVNAMKGYLVVNGFLNNSKFNEIYSRFEKAFNDRGHTLRVYSNTEILNGNLKLKPDFVLFWDKDIILAKQLEAQGIRLFNSANSIEICDNKALTYLHLKDKIAMPKTVVAPMTYRNIGYCKFDFIDNIDIDYPIVIKECCGSFGQQVYLANTKADVLNILKNTNEPVIFQEFIKESCGKDIRINMVGDCAVASMMRYNDKDFRANITNGGSMKKYEPTAEEINMAKRVCRELKLDFGGVDILFGKNGPVFCEVNSNAHFKNIFDCTGINVADKIAEYIEKCME